MAFSDGSTAQLLYRAMRFCQTHHLKPLALLLYRLNAAVGHTVIGRGADIGPGFVILQNFSIVINSSVRAGRNLVIAHEVTIGADNGESPVLGDNVFIGAGAKVLGGIRIGSDVKVGANSLVVRDLPDGATAVGVPARIVDIAGALIEPPDTPDAHGAESRTDSRAGRTATEERLAEIWSEVLGGESVGIHDDFFSLAGHSLHAMRVVSLVRRRFGVEVPLRTLFETPTVAGMAALVDARRGDPALSQSAAGLPLRPLSRDGPLPLSFAQERLWFLDQFEPNSRAYNLINAQRLKGPLDVTALRDALSMVAERHESLRTVFAARDGKPEQIVLPTAPQSLNPIDLRSLPPGAREPEAMRLGTAFAQEPYDLANGPLWRCSLVTLAEQEHLLFIGIHHIASDGWSMDVLCREILALYAANHAGEPSPLPTLPVQYADFAVWQRSVAQRRGAGGAARLLDGAAGGSSSPSNAGRPAAARRTYLPGKLAGNPPRGCGTDRASQATEPAGGRDPVYDAPVGIQRTPCALQRTG
nr:hypothetical protein Hi04_10k_c1889_00015 [uncultured bacterium]